jgi:hypothetical protein
MVRFLILLIDTTAGTSFGKLFQMSADDDLVDERGRLRWRQRAWKLDKSQPYSTIAAAAAAAAAAPHIIE